MVMIITKPNPLGLNVGDIIQFGIGWNLLSGIRFKILEINYRESDDRWMIFDEQLDNNPLDDVDRIGRKSYTSFKDLQAKGYRILEKAKVNSTKNPNWL